MHHGRSRTMQIGRAFQCMIVLGKTAVFVVVYRGRRGSAYSRGWMDLDSLWSGIRYSYKGGPPRGFGNRGNRAFISGEQGNKGQILRGTGEQRQYWGTGNIRKQIFDFWGTGEQANLFQGNKETGTPPPPWEGLIKSRRCAM